MIKNETKISFQKPLGIILILALLGIFFIIYFVYKNYSLVTSTMQDFMILHIVTLSCVAALFSIGLIYNFIKKRNEMPL
jgi:hypothetical protein